VGDLLSTNARRTAEVSAKSKAGTEEVVIGTITNADRRHVKRDPEFVMIRNVLMTISLQIGNALSPE